jgi:hypothetical protein
MQVGATGVEGGEWRRETQLQHEGVGGRKQVWLWGGRATWRSSGSKGGGVWLCLLWFKAVMQGTCWW